LISNLPKTSLRC